MLITDFSPFLAPDQHSADALPGRWQLVDYTTSSFAGRLILANPTVTAPDLAIPLRLRGLHEVAIGMVENYCDLIQLKLAGDHAFDRLRHSRDVAAKPAIQEVVWRTHDFVADTTLVLRQSPGQRAAIAYVLVRPVESAPAVPAEYPVHVTDDGFPGNDGVPVDDADATWSADAYARLGIDCLSYGTNIVGMANYPTRHPALRYPIEGLVGTTTPQPIYLDTLRELKRRLDTGDNVPARLWQRLRPAGIRTFAYARMAHLHCPPPYDFLRSTFFDAHPEYRCIDRDGSPVNRLSLVYPEVRRQFIDLFAECVESGADGVNVVFVRGLPLLLYEAPFRDSYRAAHGVDPVELPVDHPEVLAHRASYVTAYLREQRQALSAKVPVIATVPATAEVCAFYGLDPAAWIREGLIDILCPYRWGHGAADVPLDMDWFTGLVAGTPVKLFPFINTWRDKTGIALLENALTLTAWPIDGLSVWDALHRGPDCHDAIRALHTKTAMEATLADLRTGPVRHPLISFAGHRHDTYSFGWAL